MMSGSRYVPVSHEATIASDPEPLLRISAAPRVACTNRDSARNTWFATNSPALVSAPSRRARSTSLNPSARSRSAICFETAGWLMRSSAAAAENDRRRANAAKARRRASSSITGDYTNIVSMYFFLGGRAHRVLPRRIPEDEANLQDCLGGRGARRADDGRAGCALPHRNADRHAGRTERLQRPGRRRHAGEL